MTLRLKYYIPCSKFENDFSLTDDITVFSPSTFFIVIHTTYGLDLEIQLTPIMQVYIKASVSNKRKLKGVV